MVCGEFSGRDEADGEANVIYQAVKGHCSDYMSLASSWEFKHDVYQGSTVEIVFLETVQQ